MSDDAVIPPWKRHLQLATTPEKRAIAAATRQAKVSVKEALLNAFDKLGNEAFFLRLANGNSTERCCFAMIVAKMLPIEVQGQMDHALTVKIVTQLGEREIEIDGGHTANFHRPPKDVATGERLEVVTDDA